MTATIIDFPPLKPDQPIRVGDRVQRAQSDGPGGFVLDIWGAGVPGDARRALVQFWDGRQVIRLNNLKPAASWDYTPQGVA